VPDVVAAAGGRVCAYEDGCVLFTGGPDVRARVFRALEEAGTHVAGFETQTVTLADVFRAWYGEANEELR
jgi:hypothetical protein